MSQTDKLNPVSIDGSTSATKNDTRSGKMPFARDIQFENDILNASAEGVSPIFMINGKLSYLLPDKLPPKPPPPFAQT